MNKLGEKYTVEKTFICVIVYVLSYSILFYFILYRSHHLSFITILIFFISILSVNLTEQ